MKLVLTYRISDDCSYSYDCNIPFEYESKEKAAYDLLSEWERVKNEYLIQTVYQKKRPAVNASREKWHKYQQEMPSVNTTLKLGTIEDLSFGDFTYMRHNGEKYLETQEYDEPEILSLEEWFDKNKQ